MKLPESQKTILETISRDEAIPIGEIANRTGIAEETATGAAIDLENEGLVEIETETESTIHLTDEGAKYREAGLPEVRLYRKASELASGDLTVSLDRVTSELDMEGEQVDIALSNFSRKDFGTIEAGDITVDPDAAVEDDSEASSLEAIAIGGEIDREALRALERRGLVRKEEQINRRVRLTEEGITALMEGIEIAEGVGQLTPEHLTSGKWRDVEFADYNVEADVADIIGGRTHPLREMAERVKETLVGMGFKEMEGPHIDADFWIHDCLFMPQDHPARTHWDRFALKSPNKIADLPDDLVESVRRAHHEGIGPDGEGYHSPWDEDFARQLALRGHTTSLSMRYLSGTQADEIEPPARYFSVEKAYRNDTIDATHLLEFFQIEGWVMADELSVRDLMGTFTEFYEQFGITDLEFKPHYNPYTEPSFELFGRHPTTGELIEIGNSGMFRPEVLDPLGVDCDVMAWGLALERLFMLVTGAEDIRDVHGTLVDLDFLRTQEVNY
ncbi:MAG: phenylalanine--tRNA ligase subunit alpha [Halobacteriaceae archaeon]